MGRWWYSIPEIQRDKERQKWGGGGIVYLRSRDTLRDRSGEVVAYYTWDPETHRETEVGRWWYSIPEIQRDRSGEVVAYYT